MTTSNLAIPARALRSVLLAALTLAGCGTLQAANFFDNVIAVGTQGSVDLNTASGSNLSGRYCWAIFTMQGGGTISDSALTVPNVVGNIGVAQSGTIMMQNSTVAGTVYLRGGAVPSTPGSVITGGILTSQDPILNLAQSNATSAASAAAGLYSSTTGLSLSGGFPTPPSLVNGSYSDTGSIVLKNTSQTINGAAGGTYVLNLANLALNASTLTLTGDGTTNYIINVSKFMSLASNSHIVLSGGLQPQNVLFNVRNTYAYDVTMSGASTLDGIILAPGRNVKLTGGSQVNGEVIARAVSLSGQSKVINPVCSP